MADKSFSQMTTKRLVLRSMQERDIEAYLAYRNDPVVGLYQPWYDPMSEKSALEFISEQQQLQPGAAGKWYQFAVEHKDSKHYIGHVALKADEWDPRLGTIGFTLAPEFQGQGYAAEAVSAVINYAFEALNIHRVMAITDVENSASIILLERLGMRREAHFIKNIWFRGKWGSEYVYAILKEEWHQFNS